jgi:CTP:molybdopterin cytidylyltransferase MocA
MGCLLKGGGGLYSRLVVGAVVLADVAGDVTADLAADVATDLTAGTADRARAAAALEPSPTDPDDRPTCLLELGGVALIRRLLIALSGAGVDEVVVVLGRHARAIEPALQDFPITVVRQPAPHTGWDASAHTGLAALAGKLDAVLLLRADQPLLNAQDLTQVIGAYKKRPDGCLLTRPLVDGAPGLPLMLAAEAREQILAEPTGSGPLAWQAAHAERIAPFVTSNRRYRVTIDRPQDVARFQADTGHTLVWPATMLEAGVGA